MTKNNNIEMIEVTDLSQKEALSPVDLAMADNRPAKQTVRNLWLEIALSLDKTYGNDEVPLYLTLPGAHALDLKLFAEKGLIQFTETGSLASTSMRKVIAIEKNAQSAYALQKTIPGLKIVEQDFRSFIVGESLLKFPKGDYEKYCCARIINLDLNTSLRHSVENTRVQFPVLTWVTKVCQVHTSKRPDEDWYLYLTLDSRIDWPEFVSNEIAGFLNDNFRHSNELKESCRMLYGLELYNQIIDGYPVNFANLQSEEQQKVLMLVVPKKLSQLVHAYGWRIQTLTNLRYGGQNNNAHMVTWIFAFKADSRATSAPNEVYLDCLKSILSSAGFISDDGKIQNAG